MPQSDSYRPAHPRVDEDQPTVVDPALALHPSNTAKSRDGSGPVSLDDEKTVISQRPPSGVAWSASSTAMELGAMLEGRQLGHFTLEKFVGGGGMGAVFRGHDNLLGRVVAVKVLSRDQGSDPETLRRFKNEAQSAARLDHDNIARVFFVGEEDGWNFIVFEFIDGVNIRDLVQRDGPLSLELAIDFTIQVAEALAHAAQRDIVHRDIKPSNILVTAERHAKLVDMGLARLHQMEAGQSDLTASGVTLGTFDYISPEQASDPRRADVRSDLYSLGCTLFYMLTGRPPFPQGTVLQKLLAHSGEAPPDPRVDRPEIPEAMAKIVLRLMAKRPDQRYREPAELIGDLLVLRERLGLARYGADGPWVTEALSMPWQDRAIAWGAPLALVVVLFIALNVYWSNWGSRAEALPTFHRPARQIQPALERDAPPASPIDDGGETETGETDVAEPKEAPSSSSHSTSADEEAEATPPSPTDNGSRATRDTEVANETKPKPDEGSTPPRGTTSEPPSTSPDRPVSAPPKAEEIRLIVIGDASQLGDLGGDVAIFPSLEKALADRIVVEQLPRIRQIEIRTPQLVERAPLAIRLPSDSSLTVRGIPSANGELPVVRFAAPAASTRGFDGAMVPISGGKVVFMDLHLELAVDEKAGTDDLDFLRLDAASGAHVELNRCIATIDNSAASDAPAVAFIDVAVGDVPMDASVVPILLRDSIVRGRATLVRMRETVGLDLVWNNGLFISSAPLLTADGASAAFDQSGEGTIRLRLESLTIGTGDDLCVLRDSTERPHQAELELECNRCIFAVEGSLVEHDGSGSPTKYEGALHISGSHNFYEGVDVFWRVYVDNVEQQQWDWMAWKKELMRDGMPSYTGSVRWSRSRSDVLSVSLHRQGTDDYALDPAASNPAIRDNAGFVAASLPRLVRLPQPAAEPAADASVAP